MTAAVTYVKAAQEMLHYTVTQSLITDVHSSDLKKTFIDMLTAEESYAHSTHRVPIECHAAYSFMVGFSVPVDCRVAYSFTILVAQEVRVVAEPSASLAKASLNQ